jgi:hypothetical protein
MDYNFIIHNKDLHVEHKASNMYQIKMLSNFQKRKCAAFDTTFIV